MEPLLIFLRSGGAALGGTAAALVLIALIRKRSSGDSPRPRRWGAFALAAGVLAGLVVLNGWPTMPWAEDAMRAHDRLFCGTVLVGLLGLGTARRSLDLAAILLPIIVIADYQDPSEMSDRYIIAIVVLALGLRLMMFAGDSALRHRGERTGAIQIGLVLGVIAAAIGASGTMFYAQWAGTLGMGFGLITLVAWSKWGAGLLDGASAMLLAGAFAIMASTYSDLDLVAAGLLSGALPLSILATKLWGERRHQALIGWVVLFAPILATIILLILAYEPDPYADWSAQ